MTGSGTVIATLAAGVAHDSGGNANKASTSTDNTVTYDVTAPTVTINQAAGQADPTNTSPINFTVVFSEPVTDFATGDVTLSGTAPGTLVGTVTGSGTTYNVAVSGMTGSGTVIATIAAGAAHDAAGNANAASTSTDNTVTYDRDADGDDQPGGRPGRPDQRFADQLHGGLQRAGDRLRHRRRDVHGSTGRGRWSARSPAAARPTTWPSAA